MSSPQASFSSLPTEIRLHIFHLAASLDSEPTYPYFFTDGEFYFFNVLTLFDDIPHAPHPISEPCVWEDQAYTAYWTGTQPALFHREIWNPKSDEYYDQCVEGTVYKTRHALLHTCRLAREVALLEWMEFVRGLNWSMFEKVRPQVLDELEGLLRMVVGGGGEVTDPAEENE